MPQMRPIEEEGYVYVPIAIEAGGDPIPYALNLIRLGKSFVFTPRSDQQGGWRFIVEEGRKDAHKIAPVVRSEK